MAHSSRDSATGAGWLIPGVPPPPGGSWTGLLSRRHRPRTKPLKWISFAALSSSYNHVLTHFVGERIVHAQRRHWLELAQRAGHHERCPDSVVDRTDLAAPTFLVVGDPGEGDASQYCVATAVGAVPSDFMVLVSDVVYPAGDVNQYVDKFYVPYADYQGTIYGVPGNHDWYDLLHGFMRHFCDLRGNRGFPAVQGWREWVARLMWRRARPAEQALLDPLREHLPAWRSSPVTPAQPGPYYAIDAGPLRLICLDTGVTGELDVEQGAWLRRVSAGDRPKVLLTGKPALSRYQHTPGRIAGTEQTVDDIVRDPANHYIASIGGNIHNYQRYPVDAGGRRIQYLVSGGGGAYMTATHGLDPNLPPELPDGVTFPAEDDIRLYPLRGDSLAFYARQVVPWLRRALATTLALTAGLVLTALMLLLMASATVAAAIVAGLALLPAAVAGYLVKLGAHHTVFLRGALRYGAVDPDVAVSYVAEHYGVRIPRRYGAGAPAHIPPDARRVLQMVMPLRQRGPLFRFLSELFDSDHPPFFKHFLALSVRDDKLVIECRAVTGWAEDELDPPVEDRVEIPLYA